MNTLAQQLAFYAAYHRDRRNVATHYVGIPMIMVALAALLARAGIGFLSAALLAAILAEIYYFMLRPAAALVMAPVMALTVWLGALIAALPLVPWIALSLGLFVIGWVFQAIGHVFEGRKPAFFDDVRGLLIGPLFLVAEAGFGLGLAAQLHAAVRASGSAGSTPSA